MAESGGNPSSRLDRIEAQLEKRGAIGFAWSDHAEEVERRLDAHDKQIAILRQSQLETNASVKSLVGAIHDLIDRIPPEKLR